MPLILPGNVGSATATTGYEVANSLRFDDGSNDWLTKTYSGSGNRQKQTISVWIKRSTLGSASSIFSVYYTASIYANFYFNGSDQLQFFNNNVCNLTTNRLFRDTSAWMHIVMRVDTTQSTADDRLRMYVNGVQETSFAARSNPSLNAEVTFGDNYAHYIGTYNNGASDNFDGYMSEFVFTTNISYGSDSLGEFDSNSPTIWKPIDVSGLTFNTNAFYLDFENASSLGADVSGNSNNFTVNNLTSVDQSTDTCTNNFCTLNSLDNYFAGSTLAEGNCKVTYLSGSGKYGYNTGTIALTSGKWYHEIKIAQSVGSNYNMFGIEEDVCQSAGHEFLSSSTGYVLNGNNGKIIARGTETTYGNATAVNDIIGVYVDLDNNKLYFAENGTVMNSGTGQTIAAASATKHGYYFVLGGDYSSSTVGIHEFNFGGSPAFTVSSGNTDDNGFGNFEYSPNITGDGAAKKFYAICTKNLAEYG